jgi:hypothetical protein
VGASRSPACSVGSGSWPPPTRVGGLADAAALNALGELLSEHIRHEERTLFPRIEVSLDRQELAALGAALNAAGARHQPPRA